MAFFVGQRVVCISDSWLDPTKPERLPEVAKGSVYIIRGIADDYGYPGLYFEGLTYLYHQDAFRPVVEPKTDISLFTAMLTPKKATEDA